MPSSCSNITNLLLINYLSPMYVAEFTIGFLGNLFVILVYVFCLPSWISSNVYICNLAITDLICLCTLPVLSYSYMYNEEISTVGCIITRYLLFVNLYASILFMMWVGVDRLLLLLYPQRNHIMLTLKSSLLISVLNWIWVLTEIAPVIMFNIHDLKHNNWTICNDLSSMYGTTHIFIYSLLLTTIAYVLPMLILYISSHRIVFLLKNREKVLGTSFQRPVSIVKAAAVMLLVLYLPYHIMRNARLASLLHGLNISQCTKAYIEAAYIITRPIAFFHSVINPVLYVLMTDRFKEILQDKWKQFGRLAKRKILK